MQIKHLAAFTIMLSALPVGSSGQGRSPESTTARAADTVARFASLDYQGYRIGSEGHQAIWQLTTEDGEPEVFPIYVITAYRSLPPQKAADGSIRVPVEYDVIGIVGQGPKGLYFKPQGYVSKDVFPVRCTREGCKIDLDRKVFHVRPHAGKEAILTWLKKLESIQDTPPEKQTYAQLYEEIKRAK